VRAIEVVTKLAEIMREHGIDVECVLGGPEGGDPISAVYYDDASWAGEEANLTPRVVIG
jgi:hypothetical protein